MTLSIGTVKRRAVKYKMNINELNTIIENSEYPKKSFQPPSYCFRKDCFAIRSIIYKEYIYLNEVRSLKEFYQKVEEYKLDPQIFTQPFYLLVALEDFNENTITILNELDRNILVLLSAPGHIGPNEIKYFSKIKNDNIYLWNGNSIDQDSMRFILSKFKIDSDNSPELILDKINSTTLDFFKLCLKKYPNLRTRIEVNGVDAIKNLNSLLPLIPEKEIYIFLDDNLFNDQNPNNIRRLLIEQNMSLNLKIPKTKKVTIIYIGQEYKNLEEVFSLEKYLELVKSHIPSEASTLDIITYVALFIANYFEYDYKKYENIKKKFNSNNWQEERIMNLTEFITSKKGVCRDYAFFTQYLLRQLNIECEVLGTDFTFYETHPGQLGHAFNIVRIDEEEYFLDITWLAESLRSGEIKSLVDSPYFLSSNEDFDHDIYKSILDNYCCKTMDREKVRSSLKRVNSWKEKYVIHPQALKDLFRKHFIKKQVTVEEQIENAILSRRYQK